jgi:ABC-type nitrate/sulfonate/bicarbonate transport system permease component
MSMMRSRRLAQQIFLPGGSVWSSMLLAISRGVLRFALPVGLVILWELSVRFGLIDGRFLPTPTQIAANMWELLRSGELLHHTVASLTRFVFGLTLATTLGIGLGVAMGASETCRNAFNMLVELSRPIPPIALIPLAIFWLGIGDESKVFLIFVACFFPILLNTLSGVQGTDPTLINLYRTMGATRAQTLCHVLLPSALPQILTGLRISAGIGLIVLVAAEMVGAYDGLGYLILYSEQTWQLDSMFAGIITISVIGYLLNLVFLKIGSFYLHWYYRSSSSQ